MVESTRADCIGKVSRYNQITRCRRSQVRTTQGPFIYPSVFVLSERCRCLFQYITEAKDHNYIASDNTGIFVAEGPSINDVTLEGEGGLAKCDSL